METNHNRYRSMVTLSMYTPLAHTLGMEHDEVHKILGLNIEPNIDLSKDLPLAKSLKVASLNNEHLKEVKALFGYIPSIVEIGTWPIQFSEAKLFANDEFHNTPFIDGLLEHCEGDKLSKVREISGLYKKVHVDYPVLLGKLHSKLRDVKLASCMESLSKVSY